MEISRKYIKDLGGFSENINNIVTMGIDTLPSSIPYKLKLLIVVSEISTLINSFRNLIEIPESSKRVNVVTGNLQCIGFAGSGVSKDKTKSTVKGWLGGGYNVLNHYKLVEEELKAKNRCALENDGDDSKYKSYIQPITKQEFKLGTSQAVLANISELGNNTNYGCINITSSEIGSHLSSGIDHVLEILTQTAELYDSGSGDFPEVRTKELKLKSVTNLPVNFLLFGSEKGILLDNKNKNAFKKAFSVQQARRVLFSYSKEEVTVPLEDTIEERLNRIEEEDKRNGSNYDTLYDYFEDICNWLPHNNVLNISNDTWKLFQVYKMYNELYSETITDSLPLSKLSRMHKQWLTLKLSSTFALLDESTTIEVVHYIDALNVVEYLAHDLNSFEEELDKESFQLLDDYILNKGVTSFEMGVTELKELNFIEGKGNILNKLKELVFLLNDYTCHGVYTIDSSKLVYEKVVKTDTIGISIVEKHTKKIVEAQLAGKPITEIAKLKADIAKSTVDGFIYLDEFDGRPLVFEDYSELLKSELAYSPFRLKTAEDGANYSKKVLHNPSGGIRGKDNQIGGTKLLVLDVDESSITDEECHLLLSDYNHHIATTSNPNNHFKFRVLLEVDMVVDLPDTTWRKFQNLVADELGLVVDALPKSQIFYSYGADIVLSVTDGEVFNVKDFIIDAVKIENEVKAKAKTLTSKETSAMLEDRRNTFDSAYYHSTETGMSSKMINAAHKAKNLGASKEYILELMYDLQKSVEYPLDSYRFETTIISQIERWEV